MMTMSANRGWSLAAGSRVGLMAVTFGLVVAGMGTAVVLGAPPAAAPTTVGLPRVAEPVLPMPMPSRLPPAVADTTAPPAPAAAPAPIRQQKRVVVPPKPVLVRAPAPRPQPPAPAPVMRAAPIPAPIPAPAVVETEVDVAQPRSVRADLSTLGERITAKVDSHLSRLESLGDE
jgi:outer membrane biosynthesis protein TonB